MKFRTAVLGLVAWVGSVGWRPTMVRTPSIRRHHWLFTLAGHGGTGLALVVITKARALGLRPARRPH